MKIEPIIIRFTRQIFYDDHTIYQAEVRKSPLLLRGGPFGAKIEAQIAEFRSLFMQRIAADHAYKESTADTDREIEAAALKLAELGEQLYELLPEALREGLPGLLQHVFDQGHSVRLIFEARAGDQADQLLSMPWEISYVKALKMHLGRLPRVTIERRLLETVRQARPKLDPPFHIAHVIAEARDYDRIAPELIKAEREAIPQAPGNAGYYTLVAEPGSVEQLLEKLDQDQKTYQVIHFLGHGIVDQESAQSYLVFAGDHNAPQLVAAEQVPTLLSSSLDTRIIVLNTCHSASVEATNTVAMQLVYYGIPYIVAMQGEIFQKAAAIFAQTFYAMLQENTPFEEAVALSRQAIAKKAPGSIDWALPALYVSAGIDEASTPERMLSAIEIWLSQPAGQRQLSSFTIGMGVTQLVVGVLLLLSGTAPDLPDLGPVIQIIAIIAPFPPLVALAARLFGHLPVPAQPPLSAVAQGALLLRMLGASALGMGLVAVYVWLTLLLVVAMGFWTLLAPIARVVLLILLFAPGLAVSWQMALGHGRGFLSNVPMAQPTLEWQELVVFVAGYIMLGLPFLLGWMMPQLLAPPWGNMIAGIFLSALGYQLRKQVVGTDV